MVVTIWGNGEIWPDCLTVDATCNDQMSMAYRELYPIVIANIVWGHMWSRKRIVFWCDNQAVVNIINKGRSKATYIMPLSDD